MIAISYATAPDSPLETLHLDDPAEVADTISQMKAAGYTVIGDHEVTPGRREVVSEAIHNRQL